MHLWVKSWINLIDQKSYWYWLIILLPFRSLKITYTLVLPPCFTIYFFITFDTTYFFLIENYTRNVHNLNLIVTDKNVIFFLYICNWKRYRVLCWKCFLKVKELLNCNNNIKQADLVLFTRLKSRFGTFINWNMHFKWQWIT